MNVDFHIYHHLGADEMKLLLLNSKRLSEIKSDLQIIKETLTVMGQNQDEIKQTLEEIQAEQAASAARWEVRNTAQQQTINDLTELVKNLEAKNENSDAELSDELELARAILETEQQTFADAQTPVETKAEETGETKPEDSAEASASA